MNTDVKKQVIALMTKFNPTYKSIFTEEVNAVKDIKMNANIALMSGALLYLSMYKFSPITYENVKTFLAINGYNVEISDIQKYVNIYRKHYIK